MRPRRFPPPWSVEELEACRQQHREAAGVIAPPVTREAEEDWGN